jgi:hypothetical protein
MTRCHIPEEPNFNLKRRRRRLSHARRAYVMNDTDVLGENLLQCYFIYHQSHTDCASGLNPGFRSYSLPTNRLCYGRSLWTLWWRLFWDSSACNPSRAIAPHLLAQPFPHLLTLAKTLLLSEEESPVHSDISHNKMSILCVWGPRWPKEPNPRAESSTSLTYTTPRLITCRQLRYGGMTTAVSFRTQPDQNVTFCSSAQWPVTLDVDFNAKNSSQFGYDKSLSVC